MTPTLLLPGLICDARVWAGVIKSMSSPDVRAVGGYGLADTIEEMARRVLKDAPEVFNLAGHSMGGRVALEIVRMAPGRVKKLALLDTGIHPQKPGEREKRYALRDIGRTKGMAALVDVWLPPMVAEANRSNRPLMTSLHQMCCEAGLATFEAQIEALLTRPEVEDVLAAIRVPTLVATGTEDQWSPPAQHEEIAAKIKGSTLALFEGAGHFAPAEAPDQVAKALDAWLAG
ncbi:alpha/beta fold hydrolase [Kordiimonas marina]|uniref:alpha/beta fold hydrolase n=1 Tax=Kordiimonas marina TaxID=2872312 RepID=UPI001FF62053|nr:alpha/beta hydrolase [Kordiimonas marina]MCJ9427776.1 alpha/beta hydrolase [Kordiimonas marina]